MNSREYAVAVLIISPAGIPLVRDPKKPSPVYWKLPGGRSNNGEPPKAVAIREIGEETGLILKSTNLKILNKEERRNHTFVVFEANLSSLNGLKREGNEREEIKVFSLQEIKRMEDFFPNHRMILEKCGII